MTQIPTHDSWEPVLLEANYVFAYFDGLNRFYVRAEDFQLLDYFRIPVNIFDWFVPYEAQRKVTEIQTELAAARALNQDLQASEALLLADHQYFRDRLERLEVEFRQLATKVASSTQPPSAQPPNPDPLGPLGMAVVRRIAAASARFPRLAEAARRIIRLGLAVRARLRPKDR